MNDLRQASNRRISRTFGVVALLSASTFLSGCSSGSGQNLWSVVPNIAPAPPVVFQQATGRLALAPLQITLPERRSIGTYSRNVGCWVLVRQLTDADFPPSGPLTDAVSRSLKLAGLSVAPIAAGTIDTAVGDDYLLSGTLIGAQADMCNNSFLEDGPNQVNLQVDINWRLASVRQNRVVFETSTSGIGRSANKDMSLEAAASMAAGDAVTRLLQAATVQQYLTFGHLAMPTPAGGSFPIPVTPLASGSEQTTISAAGEPSALLPIAVSDRPISPEELDSRLNSAVVHLAGRKAAGFIINASGYILTALSDVVLGDLGTHSVIQLSLGNETEQAAVLLRRDASSGVALLKFTHPHPTGTWPIELVRGVAGQTVYTFQSQGRPHLEHLFSTTEGMTVKDAELGAPVIDASGALLGIVSKKTDLGGKLVLPTGALFARLAIAPVVN